MIPSVFVVLETFPLTTNGKVDRAALPAPDSTNSLRNEPLSSRLTPTEEKLIPVVSALLNVDGLNPRQVADLIGLERCCQVQLIRIDLFGINIKVRDATSLASLYPPR